MRSIQGRYRLGAAALLVGATVALAGPGMSAVADESSPSGLQVKVNEPLTLQAKGVAVSVPVTVTCPAFTSASLDVSVAQKGGNGVVSGSRSIQVQCTGSPQAVVVNVTTSSRLFKSGPAFVEASLFGCTFICGTATSSGTFTVVK